MKAALPLGSYDPVDPIMLEVSVTERDTIWNLCQNRVGELKHRPLGF